MVNTYEKTFGRQTYWENSESKLSLLGIPHINSLVSIKIGRHGYCVAATSFFGIVAFLRYFQWGFGGWLSNGFPCQLDDSGLAFGRCLVNKGVPLIGNYFYFAYNQQFCSAKH